MFCGWDYSVVGLKKSLNKWIGILFNGMSLERLFLPFFSFIIGTYK
jgi:hypothetical protein